MRTEFRFLAYADIHHDEYNNGITEIDVMSIESQITNYAVANEIKHIFFLGDWYRATNPNRSIIACAEMCWKDRSELGIKTHALVANHDRWTKSSISGHAFVSANIFTKDMNNIEVYDDISFARVSEIEGNINILIIPTGYEYSDKLKNISHDLPLIVMFHGLLYGSELTGGLSSKSGINPDVLRNLGAMLILGGDNHRHQPLNHILNCPSMYVGSPMQHNWGDRNEEKYFFDIVINKDQFFTALPVPTKSPRFIREIISPINTMDAIVKITNILNEKLEGNDGIVEITCVGSNVESLDVDMLYKYLHQPNIRGMRVIVDRVYEKLKLSNEIIQATSIEDKWRVWIKNIDNTKITGMDVNKLVDFGTQIIREAKEFKNE